MKKNIDKRTPILLNNSKRTIIPNKKKGKTMKTSKNVRKIRIVVFQDNGWWIAQCLEYDIAAQAKTFDDVQYEIQRMLIGRTIAAKKTGVGVFDNIPPAPKYYHELYKKEEVNKVPLKPIQKRMQASVPYFPKEVALCA